MKCDASCGKDATQVRDVPIVGDSLRFCDDCVAKEKAEFGKDFGWMVLTPEREAEEVRGDAATRKLIRLLFNKD